ncbi:hypothetical protein D5086_022920 [Populus alba]|uniref:Uncharacterized protein n=1 Tax=Populus alba TaxID=43335 RepID=A0ACC4B8T1_POPAL
MSRISPESELRKQELRITLWGDAARRFDQAALETSPLPIIIVFLVFLRMVHRLRYMVKPVVEEAQSALSRNLIAVTSSSTAPVKMAPTPPETKESDIIASGSPIVPLTEHGPSSDTKSLFLQVKD